MIKDYIEKYKEEFKKSINDLKHKDTFYKQIPNLLTFLRLVGGLPAGIMYYFINPYLALGMIAFLWGTDAIDGTIARKFHLQSKLGADMDAVADKIMFLASALPLLANTPFLIVNFVLEGIISSINVAGRIRKLDTKTVLSGKVKTVSLALTLVIGYLVQFLGIPSIILRTLIGLTTGLQFVAIKDYITAFIKMHKEQKNEIISKEDIDLSVAQTLEEEIKQKSLIKAEIEQLEQHKNFLLSMKEPDKKIDKNKTRTKKKNK